ncbi:MAG: hypothetical protein JW830_08455 [Bacteroidales bacterium]|nr:hypothetical protein [Bacteroidales bacterium]
MKKANLKFLLFVSLLSLAIACEKENLTENENPQPEDSFLKSLEGDTSISDVPDVMVDDTILMAQALVSQNHENLLTYTYDRSGRLDYISYIRKCAITPASDVNLVPRYAYMRDRFVYGNSGQLAELQRYTLTEKPQETSLNLVKYFKYNSIGQLEQIITRRPDVSYKWDKFEYLFYDPSGNMIRKLVREPDQPTHYFSYSYDKSNRLVRVTGYTNEINRLRFVCDLFYDSFDNIERKEFYYPVMTNATSTNDVVRKWVVYYKYDNYSNPFKDLKLPVASLFEWMDVVSTNNIRAILFDNGSLDRMVYYKYRYNNAGYPVMRFRISPLTMDE